MSHLPCQLLSPPLCSSSSLQPQLGCCWSLAQLQFLSSSSPCLPISLCPTWGELLWVAFQFSNSLFSFSSCQFFIIYWLFVSTIRYFISRVSNQFFFVTVLLYGLITHSLPGRQNYTCFRVFSVHFITEYELECFLLFMVCMYLWDSMISELFFLKLRVTGRDTPGHWDRPHSLQWVQDGGMSCQGFLVAGLLSPVLISPSVYPVNWGPHQGKTAGLSVPRGPVFQWVNPF